MSEQEKFLTRWSRRKLKGAPDDAATAPAKPDAVADRSASPPDANVARQANERRDEKEAPFDISQLPSLDSITAETDIRDFLKPGVPSDLSRAALRRAWATDPAIRDFVNLQENSWDFNAPGEMYGFGPLKPTDLRRLLAQAVGEPEPVEQVKTALANPSGKAEPENAAVARDAEEKTAEAAPPEPVASEQPLAELEMLQQHNDDIAPQQIEPSDAPARRRRSGSAMPR